jgi:hypothetical protein
MKKYQDHDGALVLFTKSHWMCAETTVLYLTWIMQMFPDDVVGLILDYAPCHRSALVETELIRMNEENRVKGLRGRLVLEWIDPSLTSVYQPGDISINKPLKNSVRRRHAQLVATATQREGYKPGEEFKVSRDMLLEIIEDACKDINAENRGPNTTILDTFAKCGLNPFVTGDAQTEFRAHLESLSQEKVYQVMISNNAALKLPSVLEADEN